MDREPDPRTRHAPQHLRGQSTEVRVFEGSEAIGMIGVLAPEWSVNGQAEA